MISAGWRARWAALPGNTRGIVWALLNAFGYSLSVVFIKGSGANLPVVQIIFFSVLGQMVYLAPVTMRDTAGILRGRRFGMHITRVLVLLATMLTGFAAVVYLPVANSTSITFAKPMFTTVLAVLILHEIVVWQRWTLTAIGFVGVLILARPDVEGFGWASGAAVASALLAALGSIITRHLAQTERPSTLILFQAVITVALLAPFVWWQWVTPSPWEWFALLVVAATGAGGGLVQILAVRAAQASVVAPIDYSRLVFSTVLGYFVFAEVPSLWTLLGIAIIVASSLAALRYER